MTPPRMFSWKSSASVQNQLSTSIHFWTFFQKILVVESFFWTNYRLAVQSSDYTLKLLHQECFLGNLPLLFRTPAAYSHPIFENFSRNTGGRVLLLVKLQTGCSE